MLLELSDVLKIRRTKKGYKLSNPMQGCTWSDTGTINAYSGAWTGEIFWVSRSGLKKILRKINCIKNEYKVDIAWDIVQENAERTLRKGWTRQ